MRGRQNTHRDRHTHKKKEREREPAAALHSLSLFVFARLFQMCFFLYDLHPSRVRWLRDDEIVLFMHYGLTLSAVLAVVRAERLFVTPSLKRPRRLVLSS